MTCQLPLIPNLEYLRRQAKGLLEMCATGDMNAIAQVRRTVSALGALPMEAVASSIRLCHAQEATARAYGYARWSDLRESVEVARNKAEALSAALADPRIEDLNFRSQIARCKGLPEIGFSKVSKHGVRYDVVDYMPAVSCVGAVRVRAGGPETHINDLLPVIAFPEMSDRLYELYIETDCVTTRPMIFLDTLPEMHPSMAAPGHNQVLTVAAEHPLYFHFDAARLHETIIAHELGNIWMEKVKQCEDYRHLKDQSNLFRITQFQHIQSFVLDLLVNEMLMWRGFDMSIIAQHQAETIYNVAAHCARGEGPKNSLVLASVINVIAGALLEMERFPSAWGPGIRDALEMISIGLPEAFEPAKGFVRSVLRHGYNDSASIRRVVDDCAVISFTATGDTFDPDTDLIEVPHDEPKWDKRPDFLSCLPLSAKLEVCRETARHEMTGRAKYDIVVSYPHRAHVVISDPDGIMAEPIHQSYNLPVRPPNTRMMPGAPVPQLPPGSAYIPLPGLPYPPGSHPAPYLPSHSATHSGASGNNLMGNTSPGFHQPGASTPAIPDPLRGVPAYALHAYPSAALNASAGVSPYGPNAAQDFIPGRIPSNPNQNGFNHAPMLPDPLAEAKRQNEELATKRGEERYRQRLLQEERMQRHSESYSGKDLKPCLTPPGEEYARLHLRRRITAHEPIRNYMAGLGLWISRVGFTQQSAGEHPYGYANNNPVTFIDPDGNAPQKPGQETQKPVSLIGSQYTNCKAHTKACIDYIFKKHGPTTHRCYSKPEMKNWSQDLMNCACVNGNQGADPLLLLAVAKCESNFVTVPSPTPGMTDVRCHNQFGWWFNPIRDHPLPPGGPSIGMIRLCKPGPNPNTPGPITSYKEAACGTAKKILADNGIQWGHINSGDCISKTLPQWKKECKDAGL